MTAIEMLQFEHSLSSAFHCGECRCRELRLSCEEADYLRTTYPSVHMTALDESIDKRWYEITFPHQK
jgi:hypothetical protein